MHVHQHVAPRSRHGQNLLRALCADTLAPPVSNTCLRPMLHPRRFLKIATIFNQKDSRSFQQWVPNYIFYLLMNVSKESILTVLSKLYAGMK